MKWSFASVALIVLGITGIVVLLLFQQITTNNENDYYLLKEVTEAAMIDAIDVSYYRETGNLKIIKEKFVENFTRRFAESTMFVSSDYKINFYDIIETPPKVSIIIDTGVGEYTIHGNSDDYNIVNKLDAILEYTGKYTNVSVGDQYYGNPYVSYTKEYYYYAIPNGDNYYSLKVPSELFLPNIKNVQIENVVYDSVVTDENELNFGLLKYNLLYNNHSIDFGYYIRDLDSFDKNVDKINITYYNCDSRSGVISNLYNCDVNNNYFVSIDGNVSNNVMLKYKVIWSYEEYEI